MKPRAALALVSIALAALALGGCEKLILDHKVDGVKARVSTVFEGFLAGKSATGNDLQLSVCRWWRDVAFIGDLNELEIASDAFDRWRMERSMYPRISSYEILDAQVVEGADLFTVVVTVKVDGKKHKLRVPEKAQITWMQRRR